MADDVRLTDLQVIQRYSIAVRGETADRDELVAALRADLDWLQGAAARRRAVAEEDGVASPRRAAPRRAAPVARKAATQSTAKRTPAKKAAKPARRGR